MSRYFCLVRWHHPTVCFIQTHTPSFLFPSGFMNTWHPAWFHIHLGLFRNSGIDSALKHTDNVPFMIPLEILLHIRNKYYPSTCFVVNSALSVDVSCSRTHSSSLRNLYLKWPCPVLFCEIKPGFGIGRDKVSEGNAFWIIQVDFYALIVYIKSNRMIWNMKHHLN